MLNRGFVTPIRVVFMLGLSLAATCSQAAVDCATLGKTTGGPDDNFRPPVTATVIGAGRAYFHSAPASACVTKHLFIVPGNNVTAYKPYKNWYQVMYVNGKTGEDFEGWIEDRRLRLEGTVGADDDQ